MSTPLALLLTDVVDSTRLNDDLGDAVMAPVWQAHDQGARALMQQWRGREIGRSDGFLIVFDTVADALSFAHSYHRQLAALPVPLQARAGLHWGSATLRRNRSEDTERGATLYDLDGIALPVAARVMTTAAARQTLLTADAVRALGIPSERLVSHGHWCFKGVAEPMELFEAEDGEAPLTPPQDAEKSWRVVRQGGEWCPARSLPHSLPAERDRFIGRSEPLRQLAATFDEGARLVTLLGIGGIGKTRLALRFAHAWLGGWSGGAWFCDLASARSRDGIVHAVAQGLEIELGRGDAVQQLGAAIAGHGRCLVVLDNFEQVVSHAEATLGSWLQRAPLAAFLVTSREALSIVGEHTLALPPLELAEAQALFVERVKAAGVREDYAGAEAAALQPLVEMLDCLPLALELAAARARLMPPTQLLQRMGQRFQLLASRHGRIDRQATLRAAIDWSWELLAEPERAALVQLGVFDGGFTLDAAAAVVELPGGGWVPDAVQALLDKSLLRRRAGERLDMLVTVQHYLHERGQGSAGQNDVAWAKLAAQAGHRHWQHFARLNEDEAVRGRGIELDNLMVACTRAAAARDDESAVMLLAHASAVLRLTGPLSAITALAELLLAPISPPLASTLRARVQGVAGGALLLLGRIERSRSTLREALAALHEADRWRAAALCSLGDLESRSGDAAEAKRLLTEALALSAAAGDSRQQCRVLNAMGALASREARWPEARLNYEAGLRLARAAEDAGWEGLLLGNLAVLAHQLGDMTEAAAHYQRAVELAEQTGDRRGEGDRRCNLGMLLLERGELVAARAELERASAIAGATGYVRLQGVTQCNLGLALEAEGLPSIALAAFEAALATADDDPRAEGQYRTYVGRALLRVGRSVDARQCLERASALVGSDGDPSLRCLLQCATAEVAIAEGDLRGAEIAVGQAVVLQEQLGGGPDSETGREVARLVSLSSLAAEAPSVSSSQ